MAAGMELPPPGFARVGGKTKLLNGLNLDIIDHMLLYESNEYRASKDWPYALTAGCMVYRSCETGFQVLLLKRKKGHPNNLVDAVSYNLPKGHVSVSEKLTDTAQRETEEEAGCKVEIKTFLGEIYHEFQHPVHKNFNKKTTLYFAAEWKRDIDKIDEEHDEKVWVDIDDAIRLLGPPNPKGEDEIVQRLKKFLELSSAG
jgi:8-oxo-dGTP pyrophosphatase MutT (NUDIX family)